jgi:hypothetical protein
VLPNAALKGRAALVGGESHHDTSACIGGNGDRETMPDAEMGCLVEHVPFPPRRIGR